MTVEVTIAVSVLGVGPLVTFGFMVIPPLIIRNLARTMPQFLIGSSVIGVVTSVVGFAIALRKDLPVGPTDVALLGSIYAVTALGRRGWVLLRGRRTV